MPDFKAINMCLQEPLREQEAENYRFFLGLPETDPSRYNIGTVKGSQFVRPLFEYHGACAGCGETPYIKLLTQLFGDRLLIGNATGCSSIYGGNLPTTPSRKRADGRGPAWSNSLFEDNAEFGFGMRQTVDASTNRPWSLIDRLDAGRLPPAICGSFSTRSGTPTSRRQQGIEEQRARVEELKERLSRSEWPLRRAAPLPRRLPCESRVWAIGGDGWAYDIGYGGVDQVLASGENINILVLDTEVYSNTGGQMSKSTPLGAAAKFAAGGKRTPKKNIGMIMTTYGNVYVAQVAFGANPAQTVKAFLEAEAYKGPSLVVAYATCIGHGIDMSKGIEEKKKAVACGHWPLFRYNPELRAEGKNPLVIDSQEPVAARGRIHLRGKSLPDAPHRRSGYGGPPSSANRGGCEAALGISQHVAARPLSFQGRRRRSRRKDIFPPRSPENTVAQRESRLSCFLDPKNRTTSAPSEQE